MPLHPRTRKRLEDLSLIGRANAMPGLHLSEPLGYIDFLCLTASAKFVLTDSGGLQEETTALGVPCLTMRPSTERPATVSVGTNIVVGSDPQTIRKSVEDLLAGRAKTGSVPELWDGRASQRAAKVLIDHVRVVSEG